MWTCLLLPFFLSFFLCLFRITQITHLATQWLSNSLRQPVQIQQPLLLPSSFYSHSTGLIGLFFCFCFWRAWNLPSSFSRSFPPSSFSFLRNEGGWINKLKSIVCVYYYGLWCLVIWLPSAHYIFFQFQHLTFDIQRTTMTMTQV